MNIHNCSCNVPTNAAGQAPRKVTGQNPATAPKKVSEKRTARNAQVDALQGDAAPAGGLNPRLAAYARSVDTRLKVAIANEKNTPREQAALEAAQQHFHSTVFRMNDALLDPSKAKDATLTPHEGIGRVLGSLLGNVSNVIAPGKVDVQA